MLSAHQINFESETPLKENLHSSILNQQQALSSRVVEYMVRGQNFTRTKLYPDKTLPGQNFTTIVGGQNFTKEENGQNFTNKFFPKTTYDVLNLT